MTRKITTAVLIVLAIFLGIHWFGMHTITTSSVYPAAKNQVQAQFGVASENLEMRWFSPMSFTEGAYEGSAEFILCSPTDECFGVKARKPAGVWEIVGVVKK